MTGRARANGEGSIFPYRTGYAAYAWVTTPAGNRQRKYVYGKTREIVHEKWVKLHESARKGPVATTVPTVERYVTGWLEDVIRPNREISTYAQYETLTRLHILPGLGPRRLDRLTVRETQNWLNALAEQCQCCAQGKDLRRPEDERRCCAVGRCCKSTPSWNTVRLVRSVLRAALSQAIADEILSRNVAALVTMPRKRRAKRRSGAWSVDEARAFLESARATGDRLHPAFVLMLIMGLRKGELLGLRWEDIDFDTGKLTVAWQLQRVRGELRHTETTKTEDSTAVLPLIDVCAAALKTHRDAQDVEREAAAAAWHNSGLVFTTRYGRPIEPRNFNRSFDVRCARAGVTRIKVHDTRHTCASLLAALKVHPRVAMQILRHTRISMTMEVYTEVTSEATREALRTLGDSLQTVTQPPDA